MDIRGKSIYAFVDAANLFYGGEKSMHFRVDYEKLLQYLKEKFLVTKVFYYAGVDVDQYKEEGRELNLEKLAKYYQEELAKKDKTEEEIDLLELHQKRVNFYIDMKKFGYELRIKPTKVFTSAEGTMTTKANCDVDLTFDMMRLMSQYMEAIVMSGDGDFASLLEYLKDKKKKIRVLARFERTAREIKEIAGEDFIDFKSIRKEIEAKREVVAPKIHKEITPIIQKAESVKKEYVAPVKKVEEAVMIAPKEPPKKGWFRKIPTFRKGF